MKQTRCRRGKVPPKRRWASSRANTATFQNVVLFRVTTFGTSNSAYCHVFGCVTIDGVWIGF
jgi:hypothetical protein